MDVRVILGVFSLLVACIGYVPYIRNVLGKKTKPHIYTWLVWSVIAVVGFGIQIQEEAGPGSWLLGLTTIATFFIFLLSLHYGHREILLADKLGLGFASIAFIVWTVADQPLGAAILITLVEAMGGFFPTFRKSFNKPYEETAMSYGTYAVSICFSLLALDSYSLTSTLYLGATCIMNVSLVIFLLVRRTYLQAPTQKASSIRT